MKLTGQERERIQNARTRDHEPGYRPSLHEHLAGTRDPYRAYSLEEVLAIRRHLTGEDEPADHDLAQLLNLDRLTAYTAALADQDLQTRRPRPRVPRRPQRPRLDPRRPRAHGQRVLLNLKIR